MHDMPFDLAAALQALPGPDAAAMAAARARQDTLTKPRGALGRLEEIAVFMAGWPGSRSGPRADRIKVVVFAGNHGVTAKGVSPYPAAVTAQMVANFQAGGAAINAICAANGLAFAVLPLRLDTPTGDITEGPALTPEAFSEAATIGASSVDDDLDLLICGEMGIGNTTIAAALSAHCLGGTGGQWAGPGTGLDGAGIAHKADVIDRALARHADVPRAGIAPLIALGGRETAAVAGAVVAARRKRIPVLLDGAIVTASVLPLWRANPDILAHCLAGHLSAEPAHARLLEAMGLTPILDLGMRLGEGSGAAVAASVVRAAVATHTQMATFEEAAVAARAKHG